ncbi:hypothetical protein H072_3656 [Dactylellina haptotyla CBS 200.50]|uniref:Required for respiratory growth protein 7, mitochondrial n=1 Tax=Dactylellina haptotyla (strain CBS 200.50) TaxID=1284197 RepID=S8BSF1_DACHA|nr:hypothetical protein H072_3656 [Dactylellina haptotyla CBS 200.50]
MPSSVLAVARSHLLRQRSVRTLSTITHSDIPSFLRYAHLSGLNPTKTVFTGTLYEYTVLAALSRLPGISLTRIGGRDDAGVDLQGSWELPRFVMKKSFNSDGSSIISEESNGPFKIKIPLIVQCKNVREKGWKGPQYVRELEGALANHPLDALGVLASVRDMTPGMKKQMLASRRALGFIKVTPLEGTYEHPSDARSERYQVENQDSDGEVDDGMVSFQLTGRGGLLQQFAWNEVANRYLGGFGIGARYVPKNYGTQGIDLGGPEKIGEDEAEALEQEITLTWNGLPVFKS